MQTDDIVRERLSGDLLKRSEASTDFIVIPLFAAIIARCVLAAEAVSPSTADDSSLTHELPDQAAAVLALAAGAAADDSWQMDDDAYTSVAAMVLAGWKTMPTWCSPGHIALELRGHGRSVDTPAGVSASLISWLATPPVPSLTESVIAAMFLFDFYDSDPKDFVLLSKRTRKVRVVLADRLRRAQLTTWPRVLAAAAADWSAETLQTMAFKYARSSVLMTAMLNDMEAKAAATEEQDAPAEPIQVDIDAQREAAEAQRLASFTATMRVVENASGEVTALREERDRQRRERDQFADRHARAQSRIESLERELALAAAAQAAAERKVDVLGDERNRLAEQVAVVAEVDAAVSPGAPPPPSDALQGRRVLVFTGQEAGDARRGLADRFYEFGAGRVDCYWTDTDRGPETFPADAIIAIDTKFMGHSVWHGIEQRARAAGAWCYSGKHGVSTMAQATAAAYRVHRARAADG